MADRPTASTITDAQLDALYERLRTLTEGAANREALLTEARDALEAANAGGHGNDWPHLAPGIHALTARAERAEQQLAQVRAVFDQARGSRWAGMAWGPELAAALDGAQQPAGDERRPGCVKNGVRYYCQDDGCECPGAQPGPAGEPTLTPSEFTTGLLHTLDSPAGEGSDRPWSIDDSIRSWNEYDDQRDRHKNGEPDGIAQPARQDGHTGACGAQAAHGDPDPAEPPTSRQAGAQDREEGQS